MGWPEGPKIVRVPISAMLHTPLQGISISMKNKKVMPVESYVMPKNQKSWLPPPFGTQCPNFPGLSWDDRNKGKWVNSPPLIFSKNCRKGGRLKKELGVTNISLRKNAADPKKCFRKLIWNVVSYPKCHKNFTPGGTPVLFFPTFLLT